MSLGRNTHEPRFWVWLIVLFQIFLTHNACPPTFYTPTQLSTHQQHCSFSPPRMPPSTSNVRLRPQGTWCPVGPFLIIPARIPFFPSTVFALSLSFSHNKPNIFEAYGSISSAACIHSSLSPLDPQATDVTID